MCLKRGKESFLICTKFVHINCKLILILQININNTTN
jgi:hypothetical protein